MARFPILESLEISKPCTARWEEMKGDGQVRFCDHCQKHVHRLTELDPAAAEALLARSGDLCVRMPAQRDTRPWFQSPLARAGLALAGAAGLVAPLAHAEPGPQPAPPPPCAVGGHHPSRAYPDGGEPLEETMGKRAPPSRNEPSLRPPKPSPPPDEIHGK